MSKPIPTPAEPDLSDSRFDDAAYGALERYRRAVNYLAAAQIYLKSNALLERPLAPEHVKDRLLGHWGTVPGINLVYAHLNRLILRTDAQVLLVTGPGHGAAANLANMYVEGTLSEFYPEMTLDRQGLERFVRAFSWPGGFPSHLNPSLPGVIHEGGELGYALATAFGAALDNPDLIVACIVGDGEAETGPTAGAWHAAKFLSPATDGAVLPIVHINGYKISSPTIYGTMDKHELEALFSGLGYAPLVVEAEQAADEKMDAALSWAYGEIRRLQHEARTGSFPHKPRWPVILLRTPKGWTCPRQIDGKQVEGAFRSHQVPALDLKTNPAHLAIVERWLRSYRPEELFDAEGRPREDIRALCPKGLRRMAANPHGSGGNIRRPLDLPFLDGHWVAVDASARGALRSGSMGVLGDYLREVIVRDTAAIKQLVFERPEAGRFDINGYREEGTTTTPFDMQVRNRTSRFHLVIQTAQKIAATRADMAAQAEQIVRRYETRLREHSAFIAENGFDLPEISAWRWECS